MRLGCFDLFLPIILIGGSAAFIVPLYNHYPSTPALLAVLSLPLVYLVVSSLIYQAISYRPMTMPRCPHCRHKDNAFACIGNDRKLPRELMICARCQGAFEVWYRSPPETGPTKELYAYRLRWPQSFGRWQLINIPTHPIKNASGLLELGDKTLSALEKETVKGVLAELHGPSQRGAVSMDDEDSEAGKLSSEQNGIESNQRG